MRQILVSAILVLALFHSAWAGNKKYEAKHQFLRTTPYFNGVESTIDYHETTVGSIRTVAWCGIDNNGAAGTKWLQTGWGRTKGQSAKIYWEYTNKKGEWDKGFSITPTAAYTYRVGKETVEGTEKAVWKYGNIAYRLMPWSDFNTIEFKKAQFGAEMHDSPKDYTPGGKKSKNKFTDCQTRKIGAGYADAVFTHTTDNAANGNIETYGSGGNHFRTWDSRVD